MKRLSIIVAIGLSSLLASGQYVGDALRFSQNFPTLTARTLGMGGAFASLGSDFSSTWINPAGLGMYRKSEFVITPGFSYNKSASTYLGQKSDDFKYQVMLGNIGYVGTYNTGKDKGLVSAAYAIGYNRLNNYNSNTLMRGENSESSLADLFFADADGTDPENLNPFGSRLAFDGYLIDTIPGSAYEYFIGVPLPVSQRRTVETRGRSGQWAFAMGLNFSNVFYVGMGFGFYSIWYDFESVHREFDERNLDEINNFYYTDELTVSGSGFNANFGFTARLFEVVRLGGALHLPTYYRMEEEYYNTLYSEFDNGDSYRVYPTNSDGDRLAEGVFDYRLVSPLRMLGGASVQIGKMGLVSADLEYINYSGMRLRDRDIYRDFGPDNNLIDLVYKPVLNLKFGGELRLDNLAIRAGGAFYPSPYESGEMNEDATHTEITAGLGYREKSFFLDLGFSALMHEENYNLYSVYGFDNTAAINMPRYRFMATVGFRF